MGKMWAGRTAGDTASITDELNSSIPVDHRMYRQDIRGSIAHARMLNHCGILNIEDTEAIVSGLQGILNDLESGTLDFDMSCEDIHMFIEQTLTQRIGDAGKKLHTARSRNDQVALDLRLYLADEIQQLLSLLRGMITAIADKAEENKTAIMPGYTHLQPGQPILFAHHFLAYASMLLRDCDRLKDTEKRVLVSPIGSCALAGTTFPTDRFYEASQLGMDAVCRNSIDGVSDRDFVLEFTFDLSLIAMHLSRMAEELILWSSREFSFIELSDAFTTGSSIMPQKKNPDLAELIRGKTGRVYGDLISLLTMMKGLPLAYDKDMQEDKEAVFDALDTVSLCLRAATPMIQTMKIKDAQMLASAQNGYMNATDVADYLTKKGVPFRTAYHISGQLVALCIDRKCPLEELPLTEFRKFSSVFEEDLFSEISLNNCVEKRNSYGGTSPQAVEIQISEIRSALLNI